MTRHLFYDREGCPISSAKFDKLWRDDEYRRIGLTAVSDEVHVSTVWLGIDYGLHIVDEAAPIIIFETMIFGGPLRRQVWRYATEDQAREGHAFAVIAAREALR